MRQRLVCLCLLLAACSGGLGDWTPAPPVPDATVVLDTSMGEITVTLDGTHAPVSTTNFLTYVDEKAYDGTIFHRVIDGFMIQGGGYDEAFSERGSHDPIVNEARNGLSNERGTIAMARTNDPNSATNQFFINVVDNPGLDFAGTAAAGYAVFGRVTGGLDVVDAIRAVPTGNRGGISDVPADAVVIRTARRAQ